MKLEQKGEKRLFLAETGIEREKRERGERGSTFSLISMEQGGHIASGQDLKSEYSSRATRGHQNQEFLSEIRAESLGGHGFRSSGSPKSFVFTPRGREPSYSYLVSI